MRRGSKGAVALLALLAWGACWGWLAARRTLAEVANPHAFMADPRRCASCHLEEAPVPRPYRMMNFRRDVVSMCTGCHARPVSHPVDVAPGPRKGIALPLDPDGTMTCVTCHAPHGKPWSTVRHTGRTLGEKLADTLFPFRPARFRTAFLRMATPEGELCLSCHDRSHPAPRPAVELPSPSAFLGSEGCAPCHPAEHRLWRISPHARMLRSPRRHPEAVEADFGTAPPFSPSEIAYVLGSRNVLRFVSRKGDALVVRPPIWLLSGREWNLSYWREPDWLSQCAGCHATGLDPFLGRWVEDGIGCEGCHGPGRRHAETGGRGAVVNPAKLDPSRARMICESCHTAGHDRTGEFRYPLGYLPGTDLGGRFFGLVPKPGQDDSTFRGDGTEEDRHAQYAFWEERMLLAEGATCDLCKNFRLAARDGGATGEGLLRLTPEGFCRSCHDGRRLPVPALHDGAETAGRPCLPCHPPARNRRGMPSVHDHRYIPRAAAGDTPFPPAPESRSICFRCHAAPVKGAPPPL